MAHVVQAALAVQCRQNLDFAPHTALRVPVAGLPRLGLVFSLEVVRIGSAHQLGAQHLCLQTIQR